MLPKAMTHIVQSNAYNIVQNDAAFIIDHSTLNTATAKDSIFVDFLQMGQVEDFVSH